MTCFKKLWRIINHFEEAVLTITFSIMSIVCFVQVISRYFLGYSMPWSEELLRALFVWSSCMGLSLAFKTKSHLGVDALVNAMPKKLKKIVEVITYVIVIIFCIIMLYISIDITHMHFVNNQKTTAMQLPIGFISISLPIGFTLAIFRILGVLYSMRKSQNDSNSDNEEMHISEGLL